MYVPQTMALTDPHAIASLIDAYGFGMLISPDLEVTHLPLLYESKGENTKIFGHMSRANPQWQALSGKRVSVVFNGPHSYISPKWYVSNPAVPTWNYAAVQCYGVFQTLGDKETLDVIHQLIHKYEAEILNDTQLLPAVYVDKLLKAVVGFQVVVDNIHAKEKLGQHKMPADQRSVFNALKNSPSTDANQLYEYMQQRHQGTGG